MKFLILKSTNPYLNLATEEYLFRNETDDIFMLWQNEPTIVIGKNQNAFAEINKEYTEKNNIHIARRITGGGAVYHDLGNVNYSFMSTKKDSSGIDFAYFTYPLIEALYSLGIKAELTGRNDILAEGRKFSGNAQHSENGRVLHHGTILFDTDLDVLANALKVDESKIKSKAIKSTRSRVINLKNLLNKNITSQDFINIISEFIIKKYSPEIIEAPKNDETEKMKLKYESVGWIFPQRDYVANYQISKNKRYEFGNIDIELNMSNDLIKDITIHGDFFGTQSITDLEDTIRNTNLSEIAATLLGINVEKYIFGANSQLIIEQILS